MLRQVRAGPDALPGAVAVEDEQGRMLSLATLAPEVLHVSWSPHRLLHISCDVLTRFCYEALLT